MDSEKLVPNENPTSSNTGRVDEGSTYFRNGNEVLHSAVALIYSFQTIADGNPENLQKSEYPLAMYVNDQDQFGGVNAKSACRHRHMIFWWG
ncbi:hypothetical protein NECAME_02381 [Necator americanus]|uniref:Uncharacterized protein n=1 Tax=Necator americanus TaxID=51031 RepID=W2TF86_NECAM|nr:hypothetical protein NECAME_02381 [Necator americanus]ETN80249.1 hypothetical protein NECAME_02381 [Necator americanus]